LYKYFREVNKMADVQDLISALEGGNKADANDVFASLMNDKINGAMDDRRAEIAQSFSAPAEEAVETELEDGVETDDEVQGLSDEEAE
jgi:hypothetical protein